MNDESEPMFFIMDTRQIVGNCVMFWGKNRCGYVCDINEAGRYTAKEAHTGRDTDVPVSVELAEKLAISHVRVEHLAQNMDWAPAKPIKKVRR